VSSSWISVQLSLGIIINKCRLEEFFVSSGVEYYHHVKLLALDMISTDRLDEVVTRLTPEEYARVVLFAKFLAASHEIGSNLSFPDALRERLRELMRRSEAENLTEAEYAEYSSLAELLENADAARLESAVRLSLQDNISIADALARVDARANGRG